MRSPAVLRLRVGAALVLALAFLLAQHAALRHWTLHAVGATVASKATGTEDRCDDCTAFCALAAGAPALEQGVALEALSYPVPVVIEPGAVWLEPELAFRSRAPPVLI